ncbi:MAG: DUF1963 domain-containing protein [Anaerolineae bacterium]|nr:DUF1963 domain-containing protein [Anaerolineae bacterium]
MDYVPLRSLMQEADLPQVAAAIERVARPTIRIRQAGADGILPPGGSKLGGLPDLPPGWEWPQWNGLPQSFLAQFNLAEVAPFDVEGLLPRAGLLAFFYDCEQAVSGITPSDRGAWSVLYVTEDDLPQVAPRPTPPDLPDRARFRACPVEFAPAVTLSSSPTHLGPLPAYQDEPGDLLHTWEEQQRYYDVQRAVEQQYALTYPRHQLLGHAYPQQHEDMEWECQYFANGLSFLDRDTRAQYDAALRPGAGQWRLLCQIDSDDDTGMMWGDAGLLYFWIKQEDLLARRFDQVWMMLQCG